MLLILAEDPPCEMGEILGVKIGVLLKFINGLKELAKKHGEVFAFIVSQN